jgi:hypothetical protein
MVNYDKMNTFGKPVKARYWGDLLPSGVTCPKCSSEMKLHGELLKCPSCKYWEGQEHAYDRLMKEGKLG